MNRIEMILEEDIVIILETGYVEINENCLFYENSPTAAAERGEFINTIPLDEVIYLRINGMMYVELGKPVFLDRIREYQTKDNEYDWSLHRWV